MEDTLLDIVLTVAVWVYSFPFVFGGSAILVLPLYLILGPGPDHWRARVLLPLGFTCGSAA